MIRRLSCVDAPTQRADQKGRCVILNWKFAVKAAAKRELNLFGFHLPLNGALFMVKGHFQRSGNGFA